MRYGITLVPQGVIAPDVGVGITLQPLAAIVAPEECPECPPAGCEVGFEAWNIIYTVDLCFVTQYESTFQYPCPLEFPFYPSPAPGQLEMLTWALRGFPYGCFCGHALRFVFDPGSITGAYTFYSDGVYWAYTSDPNSGSSGIGTVQAQIDLTDAEPGDETWTDIGCPVEVSGPGA